MEFLRSASVCVALFVMTVSKISAAPSSGHTAPGNSEVLHNIIVELENVLYKLKDYAREQQSSTRLSLSDVSESRAEQTEQAKSHSGSADFDNSDISLKEALEYLVGLSKQQKIERRDHDIPFPLKPTEHGEK